ncbi:MAG: hypothetical protein QE285_03350 [Aquabacterium sp.]|nr:hypothetical protein [Aquabacterium sp.]
MSDTKAPAPAVAPAAAAAPAGESAVAPAPAKTAKAAAKAAKAVVKAAKPAAPRKKAAAPAPAAKPATAEAAKPVKAKEKLVRDSFTMPRSDFALIQQLKDRAMTFSHAPKKSELLRAGLHALAALPDAGFQVLLKDLPALKSGRPRKAG